MKKIISWFFTGTYIWHTLFAFGTYGWALNYDNLWFMKVIGSTFAAFAVISVIYTIFIDKKKKEAAKRKK